MHNNILNTNISSFIFDLDGTLTSSKSSLQDNMATVLCELINQSVVAIISGGKMEQFEKQLFGNFNCEKKNWNNLYILPTSGTRFLSWNEKAKSWKEEYAYTFSDKEKENIINAIYIVLKNSKIDIPVKTYGPQIEDRKTQISLSLNGQDAPIEVKGIWDKDGKKRLQIIKELYKYISDFEIRIGGTNTIDITKKGIDKEFGVNKFFSITGLSKNESVFLGDAIFPGGNDYAVTKTGIKTILVDGPDDTYKIIKDYLKIHNSSLF